MATDQGLSLRGSAPSTSMRRRISLAFLLAPPLAWLVVAYLGSLAVLLVSDFWSTNAFTGAVVHTFTLD
ncbi:MAG: ABC transporter permease, partial [Mycobacterium sp.]